MADSLSFGRLVEGVVEIEDGRPWIRVIDPQGKTKRIDVLSLVSEFEGLPVRLALTRLDDLERLDKMVEDQGGIEMPPVPFNFGRRR